jgi:hypothetical protein
MTHKKMLVVLSLLLASSAWAAQLSFDVDPGGTGDYLTLNAWESAQQQDLTDGGGDTMVVTCTSSDGSDDTTLTYISGWTTSAAYDITIIGGDFPSDGIWDETKYLLHNDDATNYIVGFAEDYITFVNLQIKVTKAGATDRHGLYAFALNASNQIYIDSCIFQGVYSSTGASYLCRGTATNVNLTVYNSLAFANSISGTTIGFGIGTGASFYCYNSTAYGFAHGFLESIAGTTECRG